LFEYETQPPWEADYFQCSDFVLYLEYFPTSRRRSEPHARAAGGQFTDFPTAIRLVYLLQLTLVIYQAWIFTRIFHAVQIRLKWLPKFFVILGFLGILLNAASRSSNERWNVIPAAVITWAFWYYGVRKEKSVVGW
jgi:hypothetical protein